MKCIVIDDEPLAREGMELNIESVPYLELVGEFNNALSALEFLQSNHVDLIFLDIEMPKIDGLSFLKSMKDAPLIIITTAYPQFALEAIELDVVDYLVKPIGIERFLKAANKAQSYYQLIQKSSQLEKFEDDYIYIRADRKFIRLFFDEIRFVKGMKDYVLIYTKEKRYMTAMNIKTILEGLPSSTFVRVSKSYVINIHFIDYIEIDFIIIGEHEIPLGRTYKNDFLNQHVKSKMIK